jgi:hypothetical protein
MRSDGSPISAALPVVCLPRGHNAKNYSLPVGDLIGLRERLGLPGGLSD